jgi:hypothetical protein
VPYAARVEPGPKRARHILEQLAACRTADEATRPALVRGALVALAQAAAADSPPPLDGVAPELAQEAVSAAMRERAFDAAEWMSPASAAVAHWELASALPPGTERRELGRRVLGALHSGSSGTFVALATRMAVHGGKGLSTLGALARLSVVLWVPVGVDAAPDVLALVLVRRRELVRTQLVPLSEGSLGERRLAGRILERAAFEVARRAEVEPELLDVLTSGGSDPAQRALARLLADRESLVWRHAAVARGLLCGVSGLDSIAQALSPDLGPTEWRRAATALGGALAVRPTEALERAAALLRSDLPERDPPIVGALVRGLERAADVEPEATSELLSLVAELAPMPACEAVIELVDVAASVSMPTREAFASALEASLRSAPPDASLAALARLYVRDLRAEEPRPLGRALSRAVAAFQEEGASRAMEIARACLTEAEAAVAELARIEQPAATGARGPDAIGPELDRLREVDRELLERSLLEDLLAFEQRGERGDSSKVVDPLRVVESRLAGYVASCVAGAPDASVPTLEQHRLRCALHLLDRRADGGSASGTSTVVQALLRGLEVPTGAGQRRAKLAAVVRALDAAVRSGDVDAIDVVLAIASRVHRANDVEILAEATALDDVARAAHPMATFLHDGATEGALERLVDELPSGVSHRADTLRAHTAKLARARRGLLSLGSLHDLAESAHVLGWLIDAADGLHELTRTARSRCLGDSLAGLELPALVHLARAAGTSAEASQRLRSAVTAAREAAMRHLFAAPIADTLSYLQSLPAGRLESVAPSARSEQPLPAWLPPRRTLGGFYVVRALGEGGQASVFAARRLEERHDDDAELFAVKVPVFDPRTAGQMSEGEFLQLFRREATALLELPEDPHLARFVTFDAGAKPRPILVMELVRGDGLDDLIDGRKLSTTAEALRLLDGVLAGLETMHAAGIGHLDVKPSNVIRREGAGEAVLVDFGLAGRNLRLGCATPSYGAPEVWGAITSGSPLTADVYAFGCLAFEVLTAEVLFDDSLDDAVLIARHLAHDGMPPGLKGLAADSRALPFTELLFDALRRDPTKRIGVASLRTRLRALAPQLSQLAWPLARRA